MRTLPLPFLLADVGLTSQHLICKSIIREASVQLLLTLCLVCYRTATWFLHCWMLSVMVCCCCWNACDQTSLLLLTRLTSPTTTFRAFLDAVMDRSMRTYTNGLLHHRSMPLRLSQQTQSALFSLCFCHWLCNAFQVWFCTGRALNHHLLLLLLLCLEVFAFCCQSYALSQPQQLPQLIPSSFSVHIQCDWK